MGPVRLAGLIGEHLHVGVVGVELGMHRSAFPVVEARTFGECDSGRYAVSESLRARRSRWERPRPKRFATNAVMEKPTEVTTRPASRTTAANQAEWASAHLLSHELYSITGEEVGGSHGRAVALNPQA